MVFNLIVESNLVPNPLHVFQEYLLPAPIVKLSGTAVRMSSDPLSDLKISVILEKAREHSEASGFAFDSAGVFGCFFTGGTEVG